MMNIINFLFRREKRKSGHVVFDVVCFEEITDIYRLCKNVEYERDLISHVCRNCDQQFIFNLKGDVKDITSTRHKITVYSEVYWNEVRL